MAVLRKGYSNYVRIVRLKIYFEQTDRVLERIVDEFRLMKFEHSSRKYFPNLRYVALRLLVDHGAKFEYHVPLLKSLHMHLLTPLAKRKLKGMDELYFSLKNNNGRD